jgi:hypothetical protein
MAVSKSKYIRLAEKFREQLRFIQRSCAAFDQGAEDEAIRLAQALRVVFHNTTQSTSLVTHLKFGAKHMLSSSRGHGDWQDYLSMQINLTSPQPVKALPLLGQQFKELTIDQWWRQEPVFVHKGQQYPRRRIILTAANQDGGAHVDDVLEKFYEYLCTGEHAIGITGNLEFDGEPPFPQGVTHFANNAHLALIRQFAHEALVSVTHFTWLKDDSSQEPITD